MSLTFEHSRIKRKTHFYDFIFFLSVSEGLPLHWQYPDSSSPWSYIFELPIISTLAQHQHINFRRHDLHTQSYTPLKLGLLDEERRSALIQPKCLLQGVIQNDLVDKEAALSHNSNMFNGQIQKVSSPLSTVALMLMYHYGDCVSCLSVYLFILSLSKAQTIRLPHLSKTSLRCRLQCVWACGTQTG